MYGTASPQLETLLRDSLDNLEALARARGLSDVFAMELFSIQVSAREALESRSQALVQFALEEVRQVQAEVRQTPAKPSPTSSPVRIGR